MGSSKARLGSILSTYGLVYGGLAVIKIKSQELLSKGTLEQAHLDALRFVRAATSCLITLLNNMKRHTDLSTAASLIHYIARVLEVRLADPDRLGLVQENVALRQYPCLSSHTERFGNVLGSAEECMSLHKDLMAAYDSLEPLALEDDINIDHRDSARQGVPYDDSFFPCANRLFDAISSHCETSIDLRLRLGVFRPTRPRADDRWLDILVRGKHDAEQFWLTICLHCRPQPIQDEASHLIARKASVSLVTFADPASDSDSEQEESPWRTEEPTSLECICSHTQQSSSIFEDFVQHVEYDQNNSWQLHGHSEVSDDSSTEQEYSFSELFASMNWTDVDKIVLAMQLSYALAYHHGGSWLSGRWQQPNIRFFQRGSRIPCKPWLNVSLSRKSITKPPKLKFHRFPQLLELGTILLELHIGQTLESVLDMKPASNLDEKLAYATKIYYKNLNGGHLILSSHYRRAIEFCLNPKNVPEKPELVRKAIYDNVVLPLESAISESELSEETFESLNLGSIKRKNLSVSEPAKTKKPPESTSRILPLLETAGVDSNVSITQPEEDFAAAELEEGFDLFGAEDGVEPDKSRSKDAKDWITNFKNIIKARSTLGNKAVSGRRVKVALLDTGIDLQHSYFEGEYPSGRIKSVRSWVDGKDGAVDQDGGDTSGHGTFIASLLLDLCPNVDVYVAKISKSRDFKKETVANVANALYYAQKEWAVDIITMSFGFSRGIREIWNQIIRATQADILVFAAASNDGRNQSRMFPARQSSVFAIHSTDGKGIRSHFNPPPAKDENFSILGEYIESAWLTDTAGGSGSTRHLSGTSFATPIAVSLSAFLLAYVPVLVPNHDKLFHKIQSYDGMRNLLQAIVAVDEAEAGSRYQYLGVEKFFNENTDIAIGEAFKKALKG